MTTTPQNLFADKVHHFEGRTYRQVSMQVAGNGHYYWAEAIADDGTEVCLIWDKMRESPWRVSPTVTEVVPRGVLPLRP